MKVNKLKKGSLISRLLSQKDKLKQKNKNLIKENKKLNNAFDELEKYLEEQSKLECYQTDFIGDCFYNDACKVVLDKLKQLKEGK